MRFLLPLLLLVTGVVQENPEIDEMARFRYSGLNWEGRRWDASAPVVAFGNQISALYPAAGEGDGTVASRAHDAVSPNSDHRPHPFVGPGTVRAIDVGADTPDERAIPEILRLNRDERIKYVIFDGRIFTDDTWEWRDYSGINPHTKHYHISFDSFADDDGRAFDLEGGDDMALTPKEENTVRDLLAALEANGAGTQASRQGLLDKTFKIANNYPVTPPPPVVTDGLKRGDSVTLQ